MNRRHFVEIATAGVVGACLPRAFAAPKSGKSNKPGGKVTLGVQSYSFRDRPLEEAIAGMKAAGLDTVELWQGHVEPKDPAALGKDAKAWTPEQKKQHREALRKWRIETPAGFFGQVAAKFKAADINLIAYNLSFKDDFTDEEIDHGFQMVKAMGVKIITASANQQVVARVAPFAMKHKMKVGMHNHSNISPNEFATPDDFEKAMTGKDRAFIAVNLDIGHMTAANFDPVAFLKKHHARIVTLHIKDRKKNQGDNVPFGEGDTPIKEVLATLRDSKWAIPANIEYEYKGGDTVEEMKKCLAYCRQAVAS
jgi:sugar phosphate isomerase/epimerase